MDDTGKDDATAEVLEYYRKHAQSRKLSSYFCGAYGLPTTSSSQHPQTPPPQDQDPETSAVHSPTSSITSNRKLEWDYGADIGYDHCDSHKLNRSISMPTISIQENNSSNRLVFLNSSSDTESVRKNAQESDDKEERSTSSQPSAKIKEDVLLFLKTKVGMPLAESTPNINREDLIRSEPMAKRPVPKKPPRAVKKAVDKIVTFYSSSSDSKSNTSDKESSNIYYSLGETKAKSVVSSSGSSDEELQQKILENYPKARKIIKDNKLHSFDDGLLNRRAKVKLDKVNFSYDYPKEAAVKTSCSLENVSCSSDNTLKKWTSEFDLTLPQRLKYFNRYRSRKIKNLQIAKPICVECISSNVVTDKVMQTCSENISIGIQTSPVPVPAHKEGVVYMKHCSPTKISDSSDGTNSFEYFHGDAYKKSADNPIVSSDNNMLESKGDDGDQKSLLRSVDTSSKEFSLSDIDSQTKKERDANLKLLNKLIKSKKYDVKTKQYYLNKIMKKILSPPSENTSSLDSEHITPTLEPKITYRVDQMITNDTNVDPTKLHKNLPWKPAVQAAESPQLKNTIFTIPPDKIPNSDCSNTSTEHSIGAVYSSNFILPKSDEATDWKSNKTASEIKVNSSGSVNSSDVMVKFAQNEREHQLNWINKEIEHLNKLRTYLERNKTTQTPHFKDITNINKTTSVYMITTERPNEPTKDTDHHHPHTTDSQDFRIKLDNVNEFSEIDFHLYSDQGNKDYKFKEIVAKLKPKGQMEEKFDAKAKENKFDSTEYTKIEEHRRSKVTTVKEYKTQSSQSIDAPKSAENKSSDMSQSRKSSARSSSVPRKKSVEYSPQLEQRASYKSPYSDSSPSLSNGQISGKSLSVISSVGNLDEDPVVEEQYERQSLKPTDDGRIAESSQSKMRQSSSTSRKSRDSRGISQEYSRPELDDIDELYDEMERSDSMKPLRKSDDGSLSAGSASNTRPSTMSRQSSMKKSLVNEEYEDDDRYEQPTGSKQSGVFIPTQNGGSMNRDSSFSRHSTLDERAYVPSKTATADPSKLKSLATFNELNRKKSDRPSAVSRQSSASSRKSSSRGSTIRKSSIQSPESQKILSRQSDIGFGRENAVDIEYVDESSSEGSMQEETSKFSIGRQSPSSIRRKTRDSGARSAVSIQETVSRTLAPGYAMADAPSSDSRRSSSRSVDLLKGFSAMKLPLDLEKARIVSNTVENSSENPEDCVRRVVLEVPIDTEPNKTGLKSRGIQTTKSIANLRSSTCVSSSSSSGSSTSALICSCCRKCMSKASAIDITILDPNVARFCDPCLAESKKRDWSPSNAYFKQPQHKCTCYPLTSNMTIQRIRSTLEELRGLDSYSACTCKELKQSGVCSSCCNNGGRINNKNLQKKAVAYLLTFEPGAEDVDSETQRDVRSLDEVKIKIPFGASKGYLPEKRKKHRSSKHKDRKSLQDYLATNKPNFVTAAEERRRCMIELAYLREQRCQKYKQILAMANGLPMLNPSHADKTQKRLFTTKEMKQMTAKNYKKLPEVQRKLVENRDKQMKMANRLLADLFNKNLRQNVLRGKPSLSTSVSVINLM